jgi:hypothetical protein
MWSGSDPTRQITFVPPASTAPNRTRLIGRAFHLSEPPAYRANGRALHSIIRSMCRSE